MASVFALDGGYRGGGITRVMVARFPEDAPCHFIEGDNARTIGSAYIEHENVTVNDRSSARAKKSFGYVELIIYFALPLKFAILKIEAGKHTFGTESINTVAVDGWG